MKLNHVANRITKGNLDLILGKAGKTPPYCESGS